MSVTATPQCYVKIQVSVCNYYTIKKEAYFSTSDTINSVITKAKSFASELPWGENSSQFYAWDDLTGQPLEGKQLLMQYYPENGLAIIRVEIEDYLTRGVLSMD